MSRIEKAMERAALLRQSPAAPTSTNVVPPELRRIHTPPAVAAGAEKIIPNSPYIINPDEPYSPIAEEFRKLKSTLVKLTKVDGFNNTVVITSAVPNEGKSLTSLNLAISLAQEYDHTVLLIDTDFRRPTINRYLDIERGKGFADCLLGEAQIEDVIIPTGIGRLSVITAGREVPNPVELFASQKNVALLAELKHRYPDRYIIFDTPPVLPFAEARSLAHLVDGVLLVVKEQLASQKNIKETIDALKGCKLLGMVYNDTQVDRQDKGYIDYQYY